MPEFDLINQYCKGIGCEHPSTVKSVGDDAAVINVPDDKELAISVDTMVEGIHFFKEVAADKLAMKLLAVNVSDMAAMGATAKWATLALTVPKVDIGWLAQFSSGLNKACNEYGVQLVGGDTTEGPLTLSLQIMGLLPTNKALLRSGAKKGDLVYVSGNLGDAALALRCLNKDFSDDVIDSLDIKLLRPKLETPAPQYFLGPRLVGIANSCIDVSDGLIADLSHICEASKVSIDLDLEKIPLSEQYQRYLSANGDLDLAVSGGDDYQLVFTVPRKNKEQLMHVIENNDFQVTQIGEVIDSQLDSSVSRLNLFYNSKPYTINDISGYQHFKQS